MHCAAVSLIKRTARLGDILQFMGHGNSRHDPDWVPPPDAEILAAYFRRMMAKQRWTKAQSALKTIRAMQGGLLGALGGGAAQKAKAFPAFGSVPGAEPKPPPPPPPPPEDTRPKTPEDPDSPRSHTPTPFTVVKPRRASVSELTSGASAKAKASAAMGKMPKEKDVRRMLREFRGDWFVVFVDTRFDMILAACSDECTSEVFAAVDGDGTLYFGTDRASMPSGDDDAEVVEFPRSSYFCGRCTSPSNSLVFRRFTTRVSSSVENSPLTTPERTPEQRSVVTSPEPPEEEVVRLSLEDKAGPVVESAAHPLQTVA